MFQEIQLKDPRKNNNEALGCGPPVHIGVGGLEKEKVSHFPHPGKVVEAPHVENVDLHPSCTVLWERRKAALAAAGPPLTKLTYLSHGTHNSDIRL